MQDITRAEVRKRIIDQIVSKGNVARKLKAKREWDFYKNNHKDYVFQNMCDETSPETVKEQRQIFSINLTKKIVDEFASIYNKKPERTFTDASDAELEQISSLYETSRVDETLKKANKMFKTMSQLTLQVVPMKGRIALRPLPPYLYDVIADPECPEEAAGYILSSAYSEDDERSDMVFVWWTEEYNFKTDGDGNMLNPELEGRNPIGRLPFVDISVDKEFNYWVDESSVIVDFAQDFIKLFSDAANIVRLQGFSQAVIYAEKVPEKLIVGASQLLHLPLNEDSKKDPKFEFVTPSPDLGNTLKFLDVAISTFLSSQGIDSSAVTTSGQSKSFSSGLERLLSMVEDFEASQDDIELFRRVEREVFSLITAWSNILQNTGMLIPELSGATIADKVYPQTKFDRPEMIQTEGDRIDHAIRQVDAGLMSTKEAVMLIREVDEQEADQILEGFNVTKESTEEEV